MKNSPYASFLTKQELMLPFYAATIGNPKFQPSVYRQSGICNHQLLYTRSGSGICYLNNEKHLLEQGSLLFLPAHSAHNYAPDCSEWETLYITFGGSGLNDFFNFKSGVYKITDKIDFEIYFNELSNLKDNNKYAQLSIKLYELLIKLNDIFSVSIGNTLKNKNKIDSALKIINSNINCPITEISASLGITEEHFCRIFKQYMGYRPLEYINMLKLQRAKEMLSDKSLSVGEVVAAVGFNDHSYFGKLFKKAFGVSPSEYRK